MLQSLTCGAPSVNPGVIRGAAGVSQQCTALVRVPQGEDLSLCLT